MADDPTRPPDRDEDATISSAGRPSADDAETLSLEADERRRAAAARPPAEVAGYRIIGKLGQGGMGVVWEAEQAHPRRRVALKVLRGDHLVDDYHARIFEREAESLARLKHPNIAAIYESGHTGDGHPYFAMELVRGERLDHWLSSRPGTVDAAELELRLHLFSTMCDAVHYAHQRGVIHRDLKPANIIVSEDAASHAGTASGTGKPTLKILDFGLARITDADVAATLVSEIGTIKGTPEYMSPEQARGDVDSVDTRSDVCALGVILYEMLTGNLPYEVSRAAIAEAVRVICEDPPRPLHDTFTGARRLDPDLETIVRVDQLGRYSEAEEPAKRSVEIRERRLGEHPDLAASLNTLGNVLWHQGRLDEAEAVHRRALDLRERIMPPGHTDIGQSLHYLGALRYFAADLAEADYRRGIAVLDADAPDDPSLGLMTAELARVVRDTGRRNEAEALMRRGVELMRDAWGESDPDVRQAATDLEALTNPQ